MIGELPTTLEVAGVQHPIRTDFRVVLRIFAAWGDPVLTDEEKAKLCVVNLVVHPERIRAAHLEELLRAACRFCAPGEEPREDGRPRILDWVHDERILLPAVSRAAGVPDVRALPYLHWWTFLGLFGEMPEGLFSTVLHIRQKRADGKPLEAWEQDFLRKNKDLVILHTPEEQAAIDETEAFLKTII